MSRYDTPRVRLSERSHETASERPAFAKTFTGHGMKVPASRVASRIRDVADDRAGVEQAQVPHATPRGRPRARHSRRSRRSQAQTRRETAPVARCFAPRPEAGHDPLVVFARQLPICAHADETCGEVSPSLQHLPPPFSGVRPGKSRARRGVDGGAHILPAVARCSKTSSSSRRREDIRPNDGTGVHLDSQPEKDRRAAPAPR
jgi:hypothetical protein